MRQSATHLLLRQFSRSFVQVDVGFSQDHMSVTSADTLKTQRNVHCRYWQDTALFSRDNSLKITITAQIKVLVYFNQKKKPRSDINTVWVTRSVHCWSSVMTTPWWPWWRRRFSFGHRCSCWEHEECAGTSQGWPETVNMKKKKHHHEVFGRTDQNSRQQVWIKSLHRSTFEIQTRDTTSISDERHLQTEPK